MRPPRLERCQASTETARQVLSRIRSRLYSQLRDPPQSILESIRSVFGQPLRPDEIVCRIIQTIRSEGDRGLRKIAELVDGFFHEPLRVPPETLERAWKAQSEEFRKAIQVSTDRVRAYQAELMKSVHPLEFSESIRLETRVIDAVGVHIPGGRAPYPSSVIMNVVPAQIAGVERIVLVSPPSFDRDIHPSVLASAYALGIDEIYRIGGAQAISALAFGTESIPPVDKIIGPGNLFVTLAKKELFGIVGIDIIAGPSEVMLVADESASAKYIASDLLAQAEHDPLSSAILVSFSENLIELVEQEIESLLPELSHREIASASLENYGVAFVVSSLEECAEIINAVAPEHLELHLSEPDILLSRVRNAGAIFVGEWSPETIGDYCAGPSHTLPTGGSARFLSGLSVLDFIKRVAVIRLDRAEFERLSATAELLARTEGFDAHKLSLEVRQ